MSAPNPIAATLNFLLADPDVYQQTAGRVYGGSLPAEESADMPRKAIVIKPTGGNPHGGYGNYGDQRVDICCYGANAAEAIELHQLAFTALQNMTRNVTGSTMLFVAQCVSGMSMGKRAAPANWDFAFSVWLVKSQM